MPAQRRARPVCMLVHSYYEEDARVRREAETLLRNGREVDVFALRRPGDAPEAVVDGVRVIHLPVGRHQGAGIGTYLVEYVAFLVRAGWAAARAHRRRRYALVQVHTLPDFLILGALPLRLVGVPAILDLHEAMPEFFRARFAGLPRPVAALAHAALLLQERLSIALATAAITVNDSLVDRLVGLGVPRPKITVVMNAPDLARFDPARAPARAFMADGTLRLVYAGALTPTYEVETIVEAVGALRTARPELPVTLDVYGRGDSEPAIADLVARLGLVDRVTLHGRIPLEDVPAAVARADVGIAATRRSPFTDASLSTKLFEYAAMGKPVVATALPTVERYFGSGTVATYRPADADDLARVLLALVDDPAAREARVAATLARVVELGWDHQAAAYLALVERTAIDGRAERLSSLA